MAFAFAVFDIKVFWVLIAGLALLSCIYTLGRFLFGPICFVGAAVLLFYGPALWEVNSQAPLLVTILGVELGVAGWLGNLVGQLILDRRERKSPDRIPEGKDEN